MNKPSFDMKQIVMLIWGVAILATIIACGAYYITYQRMQFSVREGKEYLVNIGSLTEPYEINCVLRSGKKNEAGKDLPVKIKGQIDFETMGTYQLTYTARYAGVVKRMEVSYVIADLEEPVITLQDGDVVVVNLGEEYVEPGYKAYDNIEKNLTEQVTISGEVDTNVIGEYPITYSVKDNYGNEAEAVRTVYVCDKRIYLTFDDGPNKYTDRLLDILDQYDAKVTFFVTNQTPANQNCIGRAYKAGHAIGVHSYTHQVASVYGSETLFWSDVEQMNEVCYEQTGEYSKLLRFPGGSSNTVSEKYCSGIIDALIPEIEEKNYWYCDWNVDSGDASTAKTPEEVMENVIAGVSKYKASVVLMHDIHEYTVDAIPGIIEWGIENGYTFLPLTRESEMIHHRR